MQSKWAITNCCCCPLSFSLPPSESPCAPTLYYLWEEQPQLLLVAVKLGQVRAGANGKTFARITSTFLLHSFFYLISILLLSASLSPVLFFLILFVLFSQSLCDVCVFALRGTLYSICFGNSLAQVLLNNKVDLHNVHSFTFDFVVSSFRICIQCKCGLVRRQINIHKAAWKPLKKLRTKFVWECCENLQKFASVFGLLNYSWQNTNTGGITHTAAHKKIQTPIRKIKI